MRERVCECCGQPLPITRFGVRMSPLKAHLVDVVLRAGPDGISSDDLHRIVFGDRRVVRKTLYAHVWQINDAMMDTGYRITGRGGFFRLHKPAATGRRDGGLLLGLEG